MLYLDYNATTPVAPEVFEAMRGALTEHFGNAHSAHAAGWWAKEAVEAARADVASLVGAEAEEVVFTSGATEASNLAIKGVLARYAPKGRHVVTVATEHAAVRETLEGLHRRGQAEVTVLPVDRDGRLAPAAFAAALRPDTVLAAVMWANNETGVVHDMPALYARARAAGVLFFTDATQAVGKVPVAFAHADLLALSAHKLYGPKGVGALVVRRRGPRVALAPLVEGGGQERGLRSGTLNVPGIVGLGAAARLAGARLEGDGARLSALRDTLERRLVAEVGAVVNGAGAPRLPNTLSLTIPGVRAERLLSALGGRLAFSTGSACASAKPEPSHVLVAMGLREADARASIRLSLGRPTTEADVAQAVQWVAEAVKLERAAGR
ncbi:MAG TPA: cysteine desulfurase family protein [Rhodothermales bacterium]|nr:cysteine desulfurase family protein [Rhodothermales bacterium]